MLSIQSHRFQIIYFVFKPALNYVIYYVFSALWFNGGGGASCFCPLTQIPDRIVLELSCFSGSWAGSVGLVRHGLLFGGPLDLGF